MSLNRFFFDGHIGAKPDIRTTSNGARVANFSIANTESYKSGDDWKDITTWVRVQVWGEASVKRIEKQADKGCYISILGKMVQRTWTGKDGVEHSTLEAVVNYKDGGQIIDIRPK